MGSYREFSFLKKPKCNYWSTTTAYSAIEQFARAKYDLNLKKDDGFAAIHLAALNDHLDVTTTLAELVSSIARSQLHN